MRLFGGKILALLLALSFAAGLLAGCGSAAATSAESIREIAVPASDMGFTLSLPIAWMGKYSVEELWTEDGRYCMNVYHKASREAEGGGLLFSLQTYDDYGFVTLPSYRPVGVLSDGERVWYLVAVLPTDVQAAQGHMTEYFSLYDEDTFQAIFDNRMPALGWTLQPMDPEILRAAQARYEYGNSLYIGLAFNELPDGSEILPNDWSGEISDNRFAVCDVNADGREELLISVDNSYVAGMRTVVYHLGESGLEEELCVFPVLDFFERGMVRAYASHNHTYGEAWPYELLRFDPDARVYETVGSVYSWDRGISEMDYDGTAFPAELDVDGNGTVYRIRDGAGERWADDAAFAAWEEQWLGGLEKLDVPWMSYTAENIDSLLN